MYCVYVEMNVKNFDEYYQRLLDNKKEYCKKNGIDFILFNDITEIEKFNVDYEFNDLYVAINNFKLLKLEELAESYDEVLYLDFDVVCNTDENFFDSVDLSKGIFCRTQNEDGWWLEQEAEYRQISTSPTTKYEIMNILTKEKCDIINTGVIGGKSEFIKRINFKNNITEIKNKIESAEVDDKFKEIITPNNEAVFSYLLKSQNIPYFEEVEWHDIRDMTPNGDEFGKFIHFINKCFWSFFKDKKYVVYSLYVDIPDDKLDDAGSYAGDSDIDKSTLTKLRMKEYYDKLLTNQKQYAEKCGADYIHFTYDDRYLEFKEYCLDIVPTMSEYNIINFYKIHLMYVLKEEYDYILYLDFDVVCNTDINFFENSNLEKDVYSFYEDLSIGIVQYMRAKEKWDICYRSPLAKQWNAVAMLSEMGYNPKALAFNTGVVGISRRMLDKLGYFDDFEDTLELMTFLKEEDGMYPELVQKSFGYDNETVFGYKTTANEVPIQIIGAGFGLNWHYQITDPGKKEEMHMHLFIHFINKRFEYYSF